MLTFPARISTKNRGFTLLELILVVLLMSVLLTFASVNWGAFSKKEAESLLEKFSLEAALLREDAIAAFRQKSIQIDLTGNTLSAGAVDPVEGFKVSRKIEIPDGYVLKDVVINGQKYAQGAPVMNFYPSALVDRTVIHFESRTQYYTILVQPLTGKVEGQNAYIEEISVADRSYAP